MINLESQLTLIKAPYSLGHLFLLVSKENKRVHRLYPVDLTSKWPNVAIEKLPDSDEEVILTPHQTYLEWAGSDLHTVFLNPLTIVDTELETYLLTRIYERRPSEIELVMVVELTRTLNEEELKSILYLA